MISRRYYWLILLLLTLPVTARSQDLVIEDYYATSGFGAGQFLNAVIASDTSSAEFKAGTRVYVLHKDGVYAVNAAFTFSAGVNVSFRAEYGGTGHYDPTVYFFPAPPSATNPPGQMLNLSGNSTLKMTHIMVTGYEESIDTLLKYSNTMILRTLSTGTNNRIIIDSCIMKTIAGQIIRTEGATSYIKITNSIFADMGHPTSNFGAGKFIDLRNVRADTVMIQNCTFVNLYDRVIRHYQATSANCIKNFIFDHNTVINDMSYHGFLSLGTVDSSGTGTLQITNNLLIDHFALGEDTAYVRQVEFSDPAENDPTNNLPRMTWVMTNKNNAAVWNIQNNYYTSTDSGAAMLALGPPNDAVYAGPYYHRQGPPFLTWNMNALLASQGKDTVKTFIPISQVHLTKAPALMTDLIRWVLNKSLDNKNKPTLNVSPIWNWTYDFERHHVEYYFDTLNCSYTADINLSAAGTDGKVIGDPRWSFNGVIAPQEPVSSIANARKDANSDLIPDNLGDTLQVYGVVTSPNLSASVTSYFIQDAGAGIDVFYNGTLGRSFSVGDSVSVVGTVAQYRGLTEIIPLQPDSVYFGYLKHGAAAPQPKVVTLHQYLLAPDSYEGELITVDTLYKIAGTWGAGQTLSFVDADSSDTAAVYLNSSTDVGASLERAYPVRITGIVNQYSSGASVVTGGYEIVPVDSNKVIHTIIVAVKDRPNGIPKDFYMRNNYPNPFNPTTTIEFGLPKDAQVHIAVYNVLGQRVALLMDAKMKPGNYKAVFNADRFSSGVYFLILHAGDREFKQKMLLLK